MVAQFVEYLVHLEGGSDGLDQDGRLDRAIGNAKRFLCVHEDAVPQARLEMVLHFWQIKIGTSVASQLLLDVVEEEEAEIIVHESGVGMSMACDLSMLGSRIRNLRQHGFDEGVSTRLLVYAAQLIVREVHPIKACDAAICRAVTDDTEVQRAIAELASTVFPVD